MPRTTQITSILDIYMLRMFNADASIRLEKAFKEGKKIEKTESSFEDSGNDYTKFTLDGEEICTVQGY
jgi:hypothetical protein